MGTRMIRMQVMTLGMVILIAGAPRTDSRCCGIFLSFQVTGLRRISPPLVRVPD
jgi:hypothetical protein